VERTNGKPRFPSRYADQNAVEKAAFEFRYSNEARTGRRKVDDCFVNNQKLLNGVFTVTPTEVQSCDLSKNKATAVRNCSGAPKKSLNIWSRTTFLAGILAIHPII
jgi:hypothetical protein